VYHSVDR